MKEKVMTNQVYAEDMNQVDFEKKFGVLNPNVPSKKYKYIGAGVGFFVGAGAGVAVSLLVNGSQEYLLGLILNNAKDFILNSPVSSVIIIAAASAVVAGLIGFAIGYSIDKYSAKVDDVDFSTAPSRRNSTNSQSSDSNSSFFEAPARSRRNSTHSQSSSDSAASAGVSSNQDGFNSTHTPPSVRKLLFIKP